MQVPDQQLVQSAVDGDDRAFHALVDRHAPALFRSALALSRNRADAEDLLQETLVAAHRGLRQFAGRSSVKTWLTTILTRKAFKSLHRTRHHRSATSIEAIHESQSPLQHDAALVNPSTTASIDRRLDVMEALKSMSDPYREVLILREIQGLSYEEIASILQVPRGTVESRLFRARAEFRERFAWAGT